MIRRSELLLRVLKQALEALDALVPRNQLALRDGDFLLQAAVLLDKLALDNGELLQVTLKEHHLLLLRTVVRRAEHVVVLFPGLIERDLEFDNLVIWVNTLSSC
jgi:hypothetical protein